MLRFTVILFILGFSSTFALSDEIEGDIKEKYKENVQSIDNYILSNSYIIEDYLQEGGRCKIEDKEYRDYLINFYEFVENINYTKKTDYYSDMNYTDNAEKIILLQEKKSLLLDGGTLSVVRYLSDGTEVTESITGYDGRYDSELDSLKKENDEIINKYKSISIRETDNYYKLQDYISITLLGTCFKTETYLEKIEEEKKAALESEETIVQIDNSKLYSKLESLESKESGTLEKLLPLLKAIKDLEKYKKHSDIINTIINYIENR